MITVSRPVQGSAVLRAVRVRLDGQEVCRLKPGETKQVAGSGREQTLQAHLDWTSSPAVRVTDVPGSTVAVVVLFPPLLAAVYRAFFRPGEALLIELGPVTGPDPRSH